MLTVRRLYIYGVSAVGFGLLLAGLAGLLRVLLDAVTAAPAAAWATPDTTREDLSLSLALVAVGLPLWAIHAWLSERAARRDDAQGAAERDSALRALYLAGATAVTLWLGVSALVGVAASALAAALGVDEPGFGLDTGALAAGLVLVPAWAYLARTRLRDAAGGPLSGSGAWLTRVGLYGAAFALLFVLLNAAGSAIDVVLRALVGRAPVGDPAWWRAALAWPLAQGAVGGAAWYLHHRFVLRLAGRDDRVGVAERASRIRLAYPLAVTLVAGVVLLTAFSAALARLLQVPMAGEDDLVLVAQDVVGIVLAMTPFAAAFLWHRAMARREAVAFDGEARPRTAVRVGDLSVAATGLALLAVGTGWCLGLLVDVLLGGDRTAVAASGWRMDLAQFVGYALAGLPAWAWAWLRAQRARAADPAVEVRSTVRRAYLYLAAGVALVASAGSLAVILYRGLRLVLGLEVTNLAGEVSVAVGVLLAGAVVLAYHALALRADGRVRAAAEAALAVEAAAWGGVRGAPVHEDLELTGPEDGNLEELNRRIREVLPAGWTLRIRGGGSGVTA